MNYEILESTENYMLTREEFLVSGPIPDRIRHELEKRPSITEADIPSAMFEIMDRCKSQTQEAIRSAVMTAHVRGIGVVRTQSYGGYITASDESELYHKIIGGMK